MPSKQDKIREGMYNVAMGMAGYQKLTPALIGKMVYEQLRFLSNSGGVIKVKRKLPLPRSPISIDPHPDYYVAQQDMLKAGYVAVEPLMKEESKK